jgi:AraC family transcriptional regulator, transcriptional activator of pobA
LSPGGHRARRIGFGNTFSVADSARAALVWRRLSDRTGMTIVPETPAILRLVPIARLASGGRWRVEAMRALREAVLLWFTQGQGRITIAGTTRGYGPHNAIFIPPGTIHGFEVTSRVQGTAVFFGRDHGLDLPQTAHVLRLRDPVSQKELNGILESIHREVEGNRPGAARAAQHHLGLLSVWLERQILRSGTPDPLPGRSAAAQRLVARYSALLERDFRSNPSVSDYAAALGVTPTHLSRACRATCGRSAHMLLEDRVLFEARRLLSETRLPIKTVAEHLGYNSASYFTRAFQKSTGTTPSAFRKRPGRLPVVPHG